MRTEDGEIIQECLSGKPQAFGILVDKYREGVYAFSYAELRDFQDAQDVTQEVFLQAYQKLRSLRNRESFAFWLYRIAYRYCVQCLRDRVRRVDRDFIEDQDPRVVDAPSLDSHRESQLDESVREALDMLPDAYREVLLLHYFGGLTIKDIARAVGASPAAIGMRLSRARAQLKEEMMAMMDTAFEGHRLSMGFTFRIVEVVKRIKINPMPRVAGLPWGLSLAAGIIITVMSLNPQMSIPIDTAIPTGSPLPVESKVLRTGEISVDILKTSEISIISSKQADGDGREPQFQAPNNALMLAPRAGSDTWTKKADMPTARFGISTCAVNGRIYAIGGGVDGNTSTSAVEEYDPSTDTWIKKTNMPTIRGYTGTCAVDGKIYVIGGGAPPNKTLPNVEEYDPETDTWTKKTDMPTKRDKLAACTVNGKIYAIGGCSGNKNIFLSVVEEYDPATDTWTRKADMPTVRAAFGSAVVNDRIFIIGGAVPPAWTQPAIATVEEYDPATDTWSRKADMLTPRHFFTASALDGKIYVFGGDDLWEDRKLVSTVEEYNPVTDTWIQRSDIPTERYHHSSSAVDGKVYIIGGASVGGDPFYSLVEEYIPGSVSVNKTKGELPTTWGEVKSN